MRRKEPQISGLALGLSALVCLGAGGAPEVPEGSVLTFYGLRQLEQDPSVPDDVKVKEWTAFLARTAEQVAYAEKAVLQWRDAKKLRLVETARLTEKDAAHGFRQRIAQWQAVVEAYPRSEEAGLARERILHWENEELGRLIGAAEEVEKRGDTKVQRIQGWREVLAFSPKSAPGKAAARRIAALQRQLVLEAEELDRIARVDAATKVEAWQDVLRGDPSPAHRRRAESRIAELSAQ